MNDDKIFLINNFVNQVFSKASIDFNNLYAEKSFLMRKRVLFFFSATFFTFLINFKLMSELAGQGPTLWSIALFTLSITWLWLTCLIESPFLAAKPILSQTIDHAGEKYKMLRKVNITDEQIFDELVNKFKNTSWGHEFLKSFKSSMAFGEGGLDFLKNTEYIDKILYSGQSPSSIITEMIPSRNLGNIDFLPDMLDTIISDLGKIKYPIMFYFTGIIIFVSNLILIKRCVLFSYFWFC